jgi:hypothetical protein
MKKYNNCLKKTGQGEIFGVALMFVVIVIGVIIFSQIKAFSQDENTDTKVKYEILAQSSLETVLKTSSGCNVDGGSGEDSIQDLINVCLARDRGSDSEVGCDLNKDGDEDDLGEEIYVCEYAIKLLNKSLYNVFNGINALIADIPFFLDIDLNSDATSTLTSQNITNFGDYLYRNIIINHTNYRDLGYNKASSDLKPWATAQRDIKVVLALYYR